MILEAIALGALVAQFVYHRWFEDKPVEKIAPQEVSIPRVDAGTPVSLLYGRARIRQPILVWTGKPAIDGGIYSMDMFFWLCIPFAGGRGRNRVHNMWEGDKKFLWFANPIAEPGTGGFVGHTAISTVLDGTQHGIQVVFLAGGPTQELVNSLGVAVTTAGQKMMDAAIGNVPANRIPGYRGYMSVHLSNAAVGQQWVIGASASVSAYSVEASTYYDDNDYPASGVGQIGLEANPANVIYDLLTGDDFGKAGLDPSLIDFVSFKACGATLSQEGHGFSMAFEGAEQAAARINEVLRHIDATLDVNPNTGKWRLKLIRPDFDPNAIPHITKDNCTKLTGVAIGGWDVVNRVRVVYENRDKGYIDDSEPADNQGNAVAQGQSEELLLEYRGVKFPGQAKAYANRELAARSKPTFKFRAIVDRTFRDVMRGDPVKVTYKGIAGMVMRVADIDRGTRDDRTIALDLISDPYYVWRNQTPLPPSFDTGIGDIDIGFG